MQIEIDDMVNIADWFTFHFAHKLGKEGGVEGTWGTFLSELPVISLKSQDFVAILHTSNVLT